jgi:hypothetical protein
MIFTLPDDYIFFLEASLELFEAEVIPSLDCSDAVSHPPLALLDVFSRPSPALPLPVVEQLFVVVLQLRGAGLEELVIGENLHG